MQRDRDEARVQRENAITLADTLLAKLAQVEQIVRGAAGRFRCGHFGMNPQSMLDAIAKYDAYEKCKSAPELHHDKPGDDSGE